MEVLPVWVAIYSYVYFRLSLVEITVFELAVFDPLRFAVAKPYTGPIVVPIRHLGDWDLFLIIPNPNRHERA